MPDTNAAKVSADSDEVGLKRAEDLRVRNVAEINESSNTSAEKKKRRLPDWMLNGSGNVQDSNGQEESSTSKRSKTNTSDQAECDSNVESSGTNCEAAVNQRSDNVKENAVDSTVLTTSDANETTVETKIKVEPVDKDETVASTTDASANGGQTDKNAASTSKPNTLDINPADNVEENAVDSTAPTTSDANDTTVETKIKEEPVDKDEAVASTDASTDASVNGGQTDKNAASTSAAKPNTLDIKPAVKVEKADATSSTSRASCKFGIRCYRQNPLHRNEEAHPGDNDYKRPQFPAPPPGTPACPYGNLCYRRNPTHFRLYTHPDDTDFKKNYRLRQRHKQQQQQKQQNNGDDDSELDDYDLEDPFINDEESDLDYVPSDDDIEDTEELDYDDCDKAEE